MPFCSADESAAGHLLGDYSALVVDEAHHLEEQATQAGGHRLRSADVLRALDRLPEVLDADLAGALETCRDVAGRLFGEAKGLLVERLGGGGGAPSGSLSVTDDLLAEPRLQPLVRNAHHAVSALGRAAEALRAAGPASLRTDLLPQPDREAEELALAASALEGSAGAIDDVLLHRRPGHVAWMELRAEQAELRDAPVAAGTALGEGLLDAARTVVLTSATLAIAGDFGFVRERLGLGARTEELALPSPFDYLTQALCIVITDIPPYDDPEYEQALATITAGIGRRLGGRTLGLFTGYGALRRVRDLVGRRLAGSQISVVAQGLDGTRRQLLTSFVENPRTVLLGTSTFWEGIDVPGDALQCVIIAKLPFAVPTDPLVRARTADLRDPFGSYVLPEAVIRLRQGFGRLIRSGTDRGVVVIANSRLQTRGLRATLPGGAAARHRGARAGLGRGRPGRRIRRRDRRWRRIHPMVKPEPAPALTIDVPPRSEIVIALAQLAPRLGDLAANVTRHLELIGTAAAEGADLVVFPELSLTGYFLKDLVTETALRLDSPEIQLLAEASRGVDAVVGCILESDGHRFHNAALYLSGGAVVHVHRKVYLPTYGLFDEARDLAAGDRFRAFEAPLRSAEPRRPWRAGMLICEDLWHPSSAYLLARDGVDLIICPSASPGRGVGHAVARSERHRATT